MAPLLTRPQGNHGRVLLSHSLAKSRIGAGLPYNYIHVFYTPLTLIDLNIFEILDDDSCK